MHHPLCNAPPTHALLTTLPSTHALHVTLPSHALLVPCLVMLNILDSAVRSMRIPRLFLTKLSQLQNKLSSSHAPSTHHALFSNTMWCPYILARLDLRCPVIYQHPAPSQARIHLRSLKRYSADSCPDTRAHCALLGSSRLQEGQPYRPPGAPLKIITDQVPGNPDPVPP